MNKTCNKCKRKLKEIGIITYDEFIGVQNGYLYTAICTNINCPIKGCLQVPLEDMPKEKSGSLRYNP